jgi:hypothetical protein
MNRKCRTANWMLSEDIIVEECDATMQNICSFAWLK